MYNLQIIDIPLTQGGDGRVDILNFDQANQAAEQAGFEMISAIDHAIISPILWYTALQTHWATPLGRWTTHAMLAVLERFRLAPRGSADVHRMLCKGADELLAAGVAGIFTPMYIMVLKKPS